LSTSKPELNGKELLEQLLEPDNVDNLKRSLQSSTLTIMALMDTLNVSEVTVSRESLVSADGGIETYYDFDTDGYVVRRVKSIPKEVE
jgi:hypothetical protein